MRLITRDSLTPRPWKNGGGLTRQIACFPPDSDLGSFDWRISMAEVAQDGAFSRFEGADRRLYILEGAGLELRFGAHGLRQLQGGEHIDFPGEAEVHGRLLDGAVTDLSIMVQRDRQRAYFKKVSVNGSTALDLPWETAALFVCSGRITMKDPAVVANRFDTVMLDARHARTLSISGSAEVLLVGLDPVG